MKRRVLMLAACCLLAGCKKAAPESLAGRVLFVANGAYDASADQRVRLGGGLRRVQWSTHPPLDARQVTVDYDTDLRPRAWQMTLRGARLSPGTLLAGAGSRNVTTSAGPGVVVTSGQLKDVLIVPGQAAGAPELRLVSHGYAAQHQTEFLPSFGP